MQNQKGTIDYLTIIGISLFVTSLTITFHEGMHALTCVLLGDTLVEISALHVECINNSVFNDKLVAGSAAVINIVVGLVLLFLLRNSSHRTPTAKFLIWILMLVNLLNGTGYFAFSGISGIGDIATVINGWQPVWLWRTLITVGGFATFMLAVYVALKEIGQFIGRNETGEQISRFTKIGIGYYIGAILTAIAAGFMNPFGIGGLPAVAGIMAVAGGLSPFAWMAQWFRADGFKKEPNQPALIIERNWGWIAAGIIAAAIYAFVLGPGIRF